MKKKNRITPDISLSQDLVANKLINGSLDVTELHAFDSNISLNLNHNESVISQDDNEAEKMRFANKGHNRYDS